MLSLQCLLPFTLLQDVSKKDLQRNADAQIAMVSRKHGLQQIALDTRDLSIQSVKCGGKALKYSLDDPHKAWIPSPHFEDKRNMPNALRNDLLGIYTAQSSFIAGLGIQTQCQNGQAIAKWRRAPAGD